MNDKSNDRAPDTYATCSANDNVPNELAAIRRALERIADCLEGWSSSGGGRLDVNTFSNE